jgi:predicted hotdog family 3-hydroxylacyl-ACP dehydratase
VLDRRWIEAHIPHQGSMCLLEHVVSWDDDGLHARALGHRSVAHPLRAHGRLGAAAGVEYAAQAMAVHGVLLAGDGRPLGVGYLASVRAVRLHVDRLDDVEAPLDVRVQRLSGDDGLMLYAFDVSATGRVLLDGRASVVLDADAMR